MRPLHQLLSRHKHIRVLGFDDAPFTRQPGSPVSVAGVICADTRFEGMLWGRITMDGHDATRRLAELLLQSKFHPQVHLLLTDGIALGGFNIVDLKLLARLTARPCIAVMRRAPDIAAIDSALHHFADYPRRRRRIERAGPVYRDGQLYYQVQGCDPATAGQVLQHLTDRGHIPEALRLAHLIGAAVVTGQSGRRA